MTTITPAWLTVPEAAIYSGLSKSTIRRLINDRKLRATYFTPRALRVSRESLDALATKNATKKVA